MTQRCRLFYMYWLLVAVAAAILVPTTMIIAFLHFLRIIRVDRVSPIAEVAIFRSTHFTFHERDDFFIDVQISPRPKLCLLKFNAINLYSLKIFAGVNYFAFEGRCGHRGGTTKKDLALSSPMRPGTLVGTGGDTDSVFGERRVKSRAHTAAGSTNKQPASQPASK